MRTTRGKRASELLPFGNDEIFFGSKRVTLQTVPGRVENFSFEDHSDGGGSISEESISNVLARRGTTMMSSNGKFVDCVLPGIPCLDVEYIGNKETCTSMVGTGNEEDSNALNLVDSRSDFTTKDWPEYFVTNGPVIKVKHDEETEQEIQKHADYCYDKAVASGVRSALVKIKHDWYRLKGSGNNEEGFIVTVNKKGIESGRSTCEIRGSAFKHTALRELYITDLLEKQHNIEGANSPLGIFYYNHPNAPLGGENFHFQPVCIVEKTAGDRRLGSHVLAGIELLLPSLLNEDFIDVEEILLSFPENRQAIRTTLVQHDNPYGMITTAELMTDHTIGHSFGEPNGLTWPQYRRDEKLFNSKFLEIELPEVAPHINLPLIQYTNDGLKSAEEVDERWLEVWKAEIEKLTRFLFEKKSTSDKSSSQKTSILSYLFSRIGYEAGIITRKLHKQARISWGTYSDALTRNDMAQLHCNAHSNNLVVIPYDESGVRQNFLSFLDLDMAFGEKTYVEVGNRIDTGNAKANAENVTATGDESATTTDRRLAATRDEKEVKVGLSKEDFDTILCIENINFMEVLVGGDASTGVAQVVKEVVREHSDKVKLVKIALYDTLLMGYMHAYNCSEETFKEAFTVAEFDVEMHRAAYSIIKMAIITQADFVA